MPPKGEAGQELVDSRDAWVRLAVAFWLMTIGAAGMWSTPVVLPAVQAEFGISRSGASLPYAATLVGFALGQLLMGRLTDRFGMFPLAVMSAIALGSGYIAAAFSAQAWHFTAAQGVLIGLFGSSALFGPLIADTSLWFRKRRGLAVAICTSGNFVGGALWPPLMQHFIDTVGWRSTYLGMGVLCIVAMLVVTPMLRRRSPGVATGPAGGAAAGEARPLGLPAGQLQGLLVIAGFACCVAMAMPQVHIVAYCGDLGYGAARGAEMLSIMLALGIISRLGSGWIADRIGGLRTLMLGSCLQCVALALYLPFDSLWSLYVVSALFGLFQGGIIPSYAIIVRELFPAREAGARVSMVMVATLAGMAAGGWMSGLVFDLAGSYRAAFLNGIGWNLLNMTIVGWLILRGRGGVPARA